MIRDDLTNKLIHFTKGDDYQQAANTLQKIISERKLRGGTGYIKGGFRCICFTESPIGKLTQALSAPDKSGFTYAPFGIMVDNLFPRR